MTSVDYLLARLPPLAPDLVALPIGPEEFSDLILDGDVRFWASGVLDWLRIANWCSNHRDLPVPFPDARIGVPVGAAQSVPVCMRRRFSSGWRRMPKADVKRAPFTGLRIRNFFALLPS